jgi:restriction endonuclease S subunit
MRDGWAETTLGEVADYINGYPFKPTELGTRGLPVVRIKQLLNPSEEPDRSDVEIPQRCHLADGDLVFSWSGTLAVRIWNRGPALLNQHLFRVVEREGVQREWLGLALEQALSALSEKTHGTTMKHITKKTLLPHPVALPPRTEQKRMVGLIQKVDSYINALRSQADAARTARTSLLHELLNAEGKDWEETTLGEVISLEYGKALKGADRDGQRFPVFGSAGQVGMHSEPLIDTGPVIVVGRKGTAGSVHWSSGPCSVIDTAYWVSIRVEASPSFVFLMLEAANLPRLNAQTGVPGLNRDRAYSVSVALPPIPEQARIAALVTSMSEARAAADAAVDSAIGLRTALLSDLLSGNHEIPGSYDALLKAS